MPVNCSPNALATASSCFCYADRKQADAVLIYLLATIAGGSMDPATLARNAACFCFADRRVSESVITYLLCSIAAAQGA